MSKPMKALHSRTEGRNGVVFKYLEAQSCRCPGEDRALMAPQQLEWMLAIRLSAAVGVSTSVRPGRSRTRTKTEPEEGAKKPVDNVRKKAPPARKAPSRGRYVDEYARPAA